jgi:hypothetical protein
MALTRMNRKDRRSRRPSKRELINELIDRSAKLKELESELAKEKRQREWENRRVLKLWDALKRVLLEDATREHFATVLRVGGATALDQLLGKRT